MADHAYQPGITNLSERWAHTPRAPRVPTLGGQRLGAVHTVRVYTCGITPYDVTHLGHAATFVWADVLASVLRICGLTPRVTRNVTDVDDVLTTAAHERGRYYDEMAVIAEAEFESTLATLGVAVPAERPRARHHVTDVVQLAQSLLEAGAAYESDGTVWFSGADVPERTGIERERALALARAYGDDPDDPRKKDPFDVALWRPSPDGAPAWPSHWGWGRPGWHAECVAMTIATLGASVDVLVGGADLAFPHHAYMAAMAEALTGVSPFARATLHVGEVRIDGAKMAKSTGNLVLVDELLADHSPAALRLLLLDRPVDQPWDFDPEALVEAQARLERLYAAAARPASGHGGEGAVDRVEAALLDGLDVQAALAVAQEVGGEAARRALTVLKLG